MKSLRGGGRGGGGYYPRSGSSEARTEYTEVNLSSELYLAPEMMYASLDLVSMIVDATQDLPAEFVKDCFSNILIQGRNWKSSLNINFLIYYNIIKEATQTCRVLFLVSPVI